MKRLAALPLLALSWTVIAADPTTPAVASAAPATAPVAVPVSGALGAGVGGQLLQLVLGLIFVLAWLMRRVQRAGPAGSQVIELVGSRALGPRDRLVLVQVGNEQVLLGVSPGSITALHVMNEPVAVPESRNTTPEFARRLVEALGNKGMSGRRESRDGFGQPGQKDKN